MNSKPDIVERLRDEARRPAMRAVCSEAADEIERLRVELAELCGEVIPDIGTSAYTRGWLDGYEDGQP